MLDRRNFGLTLASAAIAPLATSAASGGQVPTGKTTSFILPTVHVPGDVEVHVYTPPCYETCVEPLPLVVMLHGGNGSSRDLLRFTEMIDTEMASGRLAPMVIAMPSARRSLYMDFFDGSQRWETMILDDLIPHLRGAFSVADQPSKTCIAGISMGGLGALRIAFKNPELFAAVAAVEPAIVPALSSEDVGPNVHFWRPESVLHPMFGDPIDEALWQANNPASIAKRAPERLLDLAIYFEVGDQDMLHLYDGAEFLHRILFDARIAHEFRLVHGAEHVGPSVYPRVLDALGFLQRQLSPPNWINEDVLATREIMNRQRRAIGLPAEQVDPRKMKR